MIRVKSKHRKLIYLIIAIIIAVFVILLLNWQQKGTTQHVSKDLKISLSYPKEWYIDDRYQSILLTDYKTNQNRNDKPSAEQVEIYISEFSNCFSSLEDDLKYPACGEGKEDRPDEIISKDIKQVSGGTFYKYTTRTPSNEELVHYFLKNGNKILQISKEPDPSQYEKEFEEIINSIRFL
nr:hypothetical protein [Candidatus Levybacteria bacterium]